jgi:LPS export ABC transporter protein LptC
MRKTRRWILLSVIFLSLAGIAYKVANMIRDMQRDLKKNPQKILDYLPESALEMKDFHRAKVENGRKVWELFGDEAKYFKDQKEAVIKKPKFYYYDSKGEVLVTTGEQARIYLKEKELDWMELVGGIEVNFQGYRLESEQAQYLPTKDQIVLPSRTVVTGEGLALEGSRMEVEMESKKVRVISNVKTKVEPEKLANKQKRSNDKRVGG